ncbi:hypothetical protein GGS21DRAFT_524859 [Xylaria nigripes]|nr:hypothetical protein GGS21DRAFT_524859 [Xylaria nigripes]
MITDALEKSQPVCFDLLGTELIDKIRPGPRSAERRSNRLSFFEEITAEQMKTYSPIQVANILKQRENLLDILSRESQASGRATKQYYLPSGTYRGGLLKPPPGFGYSVNLRPWVPRKEEECQAKYCHRCRPSCEPRSYLSLNAIVNGEVPPTAATGFGFHRMRTRPVVDVRVMRYIGLRPIPWPQAQSRNCPSTPSMRSSWSVSDIDQVIGPDFMDSDLLPELGEASTIDSVISTPSRDSALEQIRPAWSPPSTPTSWTGMARRENGTTTFRNFPFVCDGRSPDSLKMNDQTRHQLIKSIAGLMSQEVDAEEVEQFQSICSFESPEQSKELRASLYSIMAQISTESHGRRGSITSTMAELELEEGRFHEEPLDVVDGVAVLEESVELGVPDVITQM